MTAAAGPPPELSEDASTWSIIRRISRFGVPHAKPVIFAFLLVIANALLALARPWPLKFTFDSVLLTGKPLEGPALYLVIAISAAVVGLALFDGLFTYLHTFFINRAGRAIAFDMQSVLFAHVQRLSLRFHSRKQTGDLIARVTNDVKTLRETLVDSVLELLSAVIFLAGMLALLLWLDWRLTLAAMVPAPLMFFLIMRFTSEIRTLSRAERKREGALASIVHETLGAIRLNRVFGREAETNKAFREESYAGLQSGFEAKLVEERASWIMNVLQAVGSAIVFGYGVHRVMVGAITPGELLVILGYVRGFYFPLRMMVRHSNKLVKAGTRAERILEVLDAKEEVFDRPDARPAPALRGAIAFRSVSFAYEAGAPVLRDVDIEMPAGQVTAVVGPTGAGKTTLVSLIPRLYDPTQGALLIDGVDIRAYTLESLREQISMVLQESVLLRASIAENIAYGSSKASKDDIVAAAKAANAHEFIMALRDRYDTVVGERGDTLSGGQRQRIAIARAMVRDAPILILDEPLTGLDADSGAAVLEALERLMRGKTTILITHQLYNVQHAGHVVVLDQGRVVQQGTHAALIGAEGRYRQLFRTQMREVQASEQRDVLTARP